MDTKYKDNIALSHHEQQPLCTTRLPYRQGRKLTAVKVYTINDESRHLLVFGVPSLNIRQETKHIFLKFGKIMQFNVSPYHEAEEFTETYHLIYENIRSARIAKRILDTKNFYGGLLHICYAPEYETVQETREKLLQRTKDVAYRLQYLKSEEQKRILPKLVENTSKNTAVITDASLMSESVNYNLELPSCMTQKPSQSNSSQKITLKNINHKKILNMGEINTISIGKQIRDVIFKPKKRKINQKTPQTVAKFSKMEDLNKKMLGKSTKIGNDNLEVIDATSVDNEIVTNINQQVTEKLNQKEIVIRKIPQKAMNIIKFNLPNNKS